MQRIKSFTLIELLVVIAIIVILSGLIIVSMSGVTNSANDARRKSDVSALVKSIVAYKTLSGGVPNTSGVVCDIGSNCTGFPGAIVPDYIGSIPRDPDGTYYKYSSSDGINFSLRSILSSGITYAYSSSTGKYTSVSKNLLSLNISNATEDGTISFSDWQSGDTFTSDTTEHWQGSRSIKTVTANLNSGEGFAATTANVVIGNAYTFSVYLKGSGTVAACISESTSPYPATCSSPITLTSTWTRYSVTRTMTLNNSGGVWPFVTTPTKQSITYYADGLQFEQSSSATAWVAGY